MKHARFLAFVLAALAAPLFPRESRAEVEVSFEYFQEALSPFGEWIEVADYGLCWRPTGVGEDWAPYTDGYWAYTDAGWTWVSYEDWGGITYHYGRWIHLVDEGWVWVPEYEWGPAWVSWRSNDDYVGWAPLPPEALWEETTGFSTWVDTSYDIGPDSYRFCHTRDFGAPVLAPVCVPYTENIVIIQNTVNCTNITYNHHNSLVFCGGPILARINEHCRRPIAPLKLVCEDREVRGNHGHRQPQIVRGNALAVYAPKVRRPVDLKALPITPQRVVGAEKINRGWSRVPDLAAQQQIRERLQKQTAGLTPRTAPARPVQAVDLQNVPQKAQPNAPSPNAVVHDRTTPPGRPVSPNPEQPQRPVATTPVLPRVPNGATPPPATGRMRPVQERPANEAKPVQPQPFNNPPPQTTARLPQPSRPPQVAVPEESSRVAEAGRVRVQREEQQQQENARRAAIARQQQEDAQRSNELRNREAQEQRQQNARRLVEERSQRTTPPPPRPQNEAAGQQQENARRQQVLQQQQENANRAAAARQQQQEAAQRANEMRQQQAQQNEQRQAAQRASELRQQQQQHAEASRQRQEAMQRANEMRQEQQARQAESAQHQQAAAAAQAREQQQSRSGQSRGNDDDKDKKRSR